MENDEFRIDLSGDPLDRIIAHAKEVIEITEGLLERQRQHLRELEAARGGVVEAKQEEARLDDDGNIIDLNTLWLMYDDLYAEYMSSNQSDYEKKVNDVKAENARLQAELDAANGKQETAIDGAGLTYSSQTTIETMRQDLALAANEIARLQAELDAKEEGE